MQVKVAKTNQRLKKCKQTVALLVAKRASWMLVRIAQACVRVSHTIHFRSGCIAADILHDSKMMTRFSIIMFSTVTT